MTEHKQSGADLIGSGPMIRRTCDGCGQWRVLVWVEWNPTHTTYRMVCIDCREAARSGDDGQVTTG